MSKSEKNPYRKVPPRELWILLILLERRMGEMHTMISDPCSGIRGDEAAIYSDHMQAIHQQVREVLGQ